MEAASSIRASMVMMAVWVCLVLLLGTGRAASQSVESVDPGLDAPYASDYSLSAPNYTRLAGALVPHAYDDGISAPARPDGPNARLVSNKLFSRLAKSNKLLTNDLQTIWGQLIVLDVCNTLRGPNLLGAQYTALRGGRNYSIEHFGVPIPTDDVFLNPYAEEDLECAVERSAPYPPTMDVGQVRQQMMDITGWIDAGWLYGTSGKNGAGPFSWAQIREDSGVSCKLNNAKWMAPSLFGLHFTPDSGTTPIWKMRGDLRTNKTPDLISLTEVFGLEHNRLCDEFAAAHPEWDQERLFHESRKWVIAYLQKISTREWLAAEMGSPLNSTHYSLYGYDATVDPRIENFFCSVAFRYGHSQVNSHIPLLNDDYQESELGNVLVRDWYFATKKMMDLDMAPSLLRGLTVTRQGLVDTSFVDDLRNYMFSSVAFTQFQQQEACPDLAATNIQRGRDHGMPNYNAAREAVGLDPVDAWSDLISDAELLALVESLYPDGPDSADPYVGGLLEEHVPGAAVGALFRAVVMNQFERLRNGDRFWYERKGMFSANELTQIYQTTLMDIVNRNMNVSKWGTVPGDTFFLRQRYLANIGTRRPVLLGTGRLRSLCGAVPGLPPVMDAQSGQQRNRPHDPGTIHFSSHTHARARTRTRTH
ncbi:peroxidase [Acanthamoeba castellanii str. Neff]|uniref:Peroxidase n=1 Tax=Acanthamoeba castellanii (strain ATCC 30010 / Neff) TaxID=1257118 RepID=L8GVF5_ACACF|nr:peroxidase [Acanthamoeba castellanii str. Neff]ELR16568.1 peroxidase [Acanthamoeba castellanii str. Neff]